MLLTSVKQSRMMEDWLGEFNIKSTKILSNKIQEIQKKSCSMDVLNQDSQLIIILLIINIFLLKATSLWT